MDLLPKDMPLVSNGGRKLAAFANNDSEIFFCYTVPAVNSLTRQWLKGIYEPDMALKAFVRVAKEAAIVYEHDFGDKEVANARKTTCFTEDDCLEAGARLLALNAYMIEEAVKDALKKEGRGYD